MQARAEDLATLQKVAHPVVDDWIPGDHARVLRGHDEEVTSLLR